MHDEDEDTLHKDSFNDEMNYQLFKNDSQVQELKIENALWDQELADQIKSFNAE